MFRSFKVTIAAAVILFSLSSNAANYWSLPIELLYTPITHTDLKATGLTSAFEGTGYEARLGVEVIFLNVSAYGRKFSETKKEVAGIAQKMDGDEYGLILRIQPASGFYLGGGYGMMNAKIKDSGASISENKYSSYTPFASAAYHLKLTESFKFILDGEYRFSSKLSRKEGDALEPAGDMSGWRANAGIGINF